MIRYGPHPDQVADVHSGDDPRVPALLLLHGGFWRMPYDRHECTPIARDLQARGYTVWNVEYRRVGVAGGGWPGTAEDVLAAIAHLAGTVGSEIITIGHSAGGQLAIWAAFETKRRSLPFAERIRAAAGLAPVLDLVAAHEQDLGNSATQAFLGGTPVTLAERYRAASPSALLPGGVPHAVFHGTGDDYVPLAASRAHVAAARALGDDAALIEIAGGGHMDHLDPASAAHAALVRWLSAR